MTNTWRTAQLFTAELPDMPRSSASTLRWHFADLADVRLPAIPPASGTWDQDNTDKCWNDTSAMRGGSMADALRMARDGWPEGAETARKLHDGITASLPERRRLARFDVAGTVPSVPRALAGNPLHMRRMVAKATNQRPIITLTCSIAVNWGFPPDAMIAHAAAVAAIVDFLEQDGFRCEVLMVGRTDNSRLAAEIAIKLKSAEQPLNLSVLAFGLGHPALWRRMIFGLLWLDKKAAPLGGGLGHAGTVRALPEAGTFTIQAASQYGEGGDNAAYRFRSILRDLAQQGCPGIPADTN